MTASPCIKICSVDPARGLCIGCWRTLDEIARWSTATSDERARIVAAADIRRQRAWHETVNPPGPQEFP